MLIRLRSWTPVVALLLCFGAGLMRPAWGGAQALPEGWRLLEQGGAAIQYPPEMETMAKAMLPVIAASATETDLLERLNEREEEVLKFIAQQLALPRPTRAMRETFEGVSKHLFESFETAPDLRHIRLYPVEMVDEGIATGCSVPGFTRSADGMTLVYECSRIVYDAATQTVQQTADLQVNKRSRNVSSSMDKGLGARPFFPFVITKPDSAKGETGPESKVDALDGNLQTLRLMPAGMLLHETCEIGLTTSGPRNGSPLCPLERWFSEGAGNHVAALALDRFVGEDAGEGYLQVSTGADDPVDVPVNLATWAFMGWEPGLSAPGLSPEQLGYAYYDVATSSVQDLVKRFGPSLVPDIVVVLRKTYPRGTLSQAFQKVTGVTLESALPKVYTPSANCVVVNHTAVGTSRPLWGIFAGRLHETAEVTLEQTGSGWLTVGFSAGCLQPPAKIEARLLGPDNAVLDSKKIDLTFPALHFNVSFRPDPAKLKRGPHRIELRLNDRLCKELPLQVI